MAPELEVTKKDVAATMEKLAIDQEAADKERAIVAKDEAEATQQEQEASELMADAQAELDKANPLLEEATKVLKELKVEDIEFLKSLKKPSATMVIGFELACQMMQKKPKPDMKNKVEGDGAGYFTCGQMTLFKDAKGFLKMMIDYDRENIPAAVVKRVNAILTSPDFTHEKVKNASVALLAVLKWSSAMMKYYELLKVVNPKREKVAEMNEKLVIVRGELAQKRAQLKQVEDTIAALKAMFKEKKELEESLQAKIDDCNIKLGRANRIIQGLAGEKTRWMDTVEKLTIDYEYLIGDCLVAAGMVAYSGSFTATFR